jgi:hypothetical protein
MTAHPNQPQETMFEELFSISEKPDPYSVQYLRFGLSAHK